LRSLGNLSLYDGVETAKWRESRFAEEPAQKRSRMGCARFRCCGDWLCRDGLR
jgi:hypothetical protein